jgi:hypothetical protein
MIGNSSAATEFENKKNEFDRKMCRVARRKGELSPHGIDQGWPHQVALSSEVTRMPLFNSRSIIIEGPARCCVCIWQVSFGRFEKKGLLEPDGRFK